MNCEPISLSLPSGVSIECECATDLWAQVADLQHDNPDCTIGIACEGDGLALSVVDKPQEVGPAFWVDEGESTFIGNKGGTVTWHDKDGKPL